MLLGTADVNWRAAANIRLDKPIGEFGAYVFASAYFYAYISDWGGVRLPKDYGDRWIVESVQGPDAVPGPRIIVEKRTGLTYSRGRRKVSDPKVYLKFIDQT
jgi:hypothetical protein